MTWRRAARAVLGPIAIAATIIGTPGSSAAEGATETAGECARDGRYGSSGVNAAQSVGMRFTSEATGTLTNIRIGAGDSFAANAEPAPLVVSISEMDGSVPGPALASVSLAPADLPNGWYDFPMTDVAVAGGPQLEAGTTYAVTFESDAPGNQGSYMVELMTAAGCPDDGGLIRSGAGAWGPGAWAHPFRVDVGGAASGPTIECGPPHPGNWYAGVTREQSVAEVFTMPSSATVSSVDITVTDAGALHPLEVALHAVVDGAPGARLSEATVPAASFPDWNDFRPTTVALDAPVALAGGSSYALVLTTEASYGSPFDPTPGGAYRWSIAANTAGCPGITTLYRTASLGNLNWNEVGTYDLVFSIALPAGPDTDGDGVLDDADTDDDNDGTPDTHDAFPLDPTETVDTDNDGTGNNADTDDDNDGTPDTHDAFPLDATRDGDENDDGILDTPPPTSKEACMKDGWRTFNNPSFRNQGQCVSFVTSRR